MALTQKVDDRLSKLEDKQKMIRAEMAMLTMLTMRDANNAADWWHDKNGGKENVKKNSLFDLLIQILISCQLKDKKKYNFEKMKQCCFFTIHYI